MSGLVGSPMCWTTALEITLSWLPSSKSVCMKCLPIRAVVVCSVVDVFQRVELTVLMFIIVPQSLCYREVVDTKAILLATEKIVV